MPFKPGQTGNPHGRPRKEASIAERFRSNPKIEKIFEQIISVASTLGTEEQHPNAWPAAKIILDKLVPGLKPVDFNNTDLAELYRSIQEKWSNEAEYLYDSIRQQAEENDRRRRPGENTPKAVEG